MVKSDENTASAGARNLIQNCLKAQPGQSLLVVGEEGSWAHFDKLHCYEVADTAEALGIESKVVIAPQTYTAADVPAELAAAIAGADHTVFFARMADQLRFLGLEGGRSMVACYTLNRTAMADPFTAVDHRLFQDVHDLLVARIEGADRYSIRCPDGTDLVDSVALSPDASIGEFAVKPFPVLIFRPIDASTLSGRIALNYPLTSSSTNVYEDSVFLPCAKVMGTIEQGQITEFEGDPEEVRRMRAHFERVGALAGGNAFAINSWHTGINPLTYCDFRMEDDYERWATAAFGSPRMTHFHACGTDPGDIAISIYDATITFDDQVFWRDGRFVFMDEPEVRKLLNVYPGNEAAFTMRWDIGIARRSAG